MPTAKIKLTRLLDYALYLLKKITTIVTEIYLK